MKFEPQRLNFYYAHDLMVEGIKFYCGDKATWIPEYDIVENWLKNNKGKGLLLLGNAGRGKTLLAEKIIPMIINSGDMKDRCAVMTAYQLAREGKPCFHRGFLVVDDIGVEDDFVSFGSRLNTFCELVDNAERYGWTLIITTNCSFERLQERYGGRTVDRLKSLVDIVTFEGESFRNKQDAGSMPVEHRAYGVDFATQEEADAFNEEQDGYYEKIKNGELDYADKDWAEVKERQPLKLWRGKLCALKKYDWDKIGE